jgi:hypothetical protein
MTARTSKLDQWRHSDVFRQIARAQCAKMNVAHWKNPKCGAKRKSDGGTCELPAMENGRCHLHGGRTPKGDGWQRPVWPDKNAPGAEKKLQRKLRDLARAEKNRAARVAAMSPAERQRYEKWKRTHKPGSAAARKARQLEVARNKEIRAALNTAKSAPAPDPELMTLQQHRAQLQAEAERLRLKHSAPPSPLGAFE